MKLRVESMLATRRGWPDLFKQVIAKIASCNTSGLAWNFEFHFTRRVPGAGRRTASANPGSCGRSEPQGPRRTAAPLPRTDECTSENRKGKRCARHQTRRVHEVVVVGGAEGRTEATGNSPIDEKKSQPNGCTLPWLHASYIIRVQTSSAGGEFG